MPTFILESPEGFSFSITVLGLETELAYTSTVYRDGAQQPDGGLPSAGAVAVVRNILLHRAAQHLESQDEEVRT